MSHHQKVRSFSLSGFVLRGIGYLILLALSIFVLLPLIWMIITAFKEEGQAFRLQLLPERQHAIENIEPSKLSIPETGVVFQYENPVADHVNIAGDFNDWNPDEHEMHNVGDIWHIAIEDIVPGVHEYQLVIDHEEWILDPGNPQQIDGNSFIETEEKSLVFNTDPLLYTHLKDNQYQVHFYMPDAERVRIRTARETHTPTLENKHWHSLVQEVEPFTITYNLPFREAMAQLYTLENFTYILFNEEFPFSRYFMNSVVIATLAGFLTVLICTFAGYSFACRKIPYADLCFNLLMLSMMIPGMIYMVPQFALIVRFGWINTYQGLVIPHIANVFGLLLLRQYIRTIPDSLFQSAKMDGASEVQIVKNIVVPLCLPIMVTLFLLVFVTQWSNFLWQLIVNTPDSKLLTLPVGLNYFRGQYGASWEAIMAGACFSIVPIAVLFLFAQRYFIEGLTQGAVKE